MTKRLHVAVLYGGTSAEHEVSVVSARGVLQALDPAKYVAHPIAITKEGRWLLPRQSPAELPEPKGSYPGVDAEGGQQIAPRDAERGISVGSEQIDVVFPVLHGPGGEDGTVQGLLEALGVPYVGAGVAASAVGMDKSLQKPIFVARGIPVTPWIDVHEHQFGTDPEAVVERAVEEIDLPAFTKPANLGSSVGVSRCSTPEQLRAGLQEALRYDRVALVERAIAGRELECGALGNDEPEASVVGEVVSAREFYDYEAKYLTEGSRTIIPADIPPATAEQVRDYSVRAFEAIGCAGMARVDFFLSEDGSLLVNEINTIPGFTPISMYPKLWEASGTPYAKLIDRLIELALERHGGRT